MIKYLGSKRRLVPVLGDLFTASGATTALDVFTGTTRVAQEFKRRGAHVTACDLATYSEVLARCYIETDADLVDRRELDEALAHLAALPGHHGYFTETFCVQSRYFQPFNGERIDAIRDAIAADFSSSPLEPVLLTALLLAADRVDSTAGVQMAYLKQWSNRSYLPLDLRVPSLLSGAGSVRRGDAAEVVGTLGSVDLAYLDPPYNQHRYFTNYHIWETLVRWDRPDHYGIACKRVDARGDGQRSAFNSRSTMSDALAALVSQLDAEVVMLSYNDESWLTREQLVAMLSRWQHVEVLTFDSRRYIGAQIGVYNPKGEMVGSVSHLRNRELVVVAGPEVTVSRMVAPLRSQVDEVDEVDEMGAASTLGGSRTGPAAAR